MIHFEIATPERIVYKTQADSITIPTSQGEITVLPHHIPLVALLAPGILTVRRQKNEEYLAVSGGFIEIQPSSRVVVLADTAERSEELTLEAVEAARDRAAMLMAEKRHIDNESFAAAAAGLERELARLKVVHKHRSKGPSPHIS